MAPVSSVECFSASRVGSAALAALNRFVTLRVVAVCMALAVLAGVALLLLIPAETAWAADPPGIAGLTPASGPTTGGTVVLITGSGFTGLSDPSAVSFDGIAAASYTVQSDNQIAAVSPAHAAGVVQLTVTGEGGAASAAFAFMNRYDQTAGTLSYSGTWGLFSTASAWKGSYSRSATSGAAVTITFSGTRLDWIAMKGTTTGVADVYLDHAKVATVDLANVSAVYQQNVWSTGDLAGGVHTVRITRSSASAAGKYLTIDAVDVLGSVLASGRVQQTDTRIAYAGTWGTVSKTGPSGGSYTRAASGTASATVDFNGTYLAWIATRGTTMGRAWVSLDGGEAQNVDLAAAATAYQQKVWDTGELALGDHEVRIWWDSSNDPGKYVSVDAFDVQGSLTTAYAVTRYQETDVRLLYSGTWSSFAAASASATQYKAAASGGAVKVTFVGKRLDWIATVGPDMGTADVSIDGRAATTVDLHGDAYEYQKNVWTTGNLTSGTHTVEISWNETNASGAYINVDAFDVWGTLPWEGELTSEQKRWVEQRLADLSYRPGVIDGVFDSRTRGAVIAFQKWEGLTRDGNVTLSLVLRLQNAHRPQPSRNGATQSWIEVNKAKQVLLYCRNGAVVWTLPVSTGNASVGIATPSGTFRVTRKTLETSPRYLPLYISTTLLAIHGYPNVPTYPASHGCVRTHLWDQDALQPLIPVGTYVYIY